MAKRIPIPPSVFLPADFTPADIRAIRAVAAGTATPEQQQRAFNWILYNAADTYGLEYRTDQRDHAFASGRRWVGLQLVKMLKVPLSAVEGVDTPGVVGAYSTPQSADE